ncbi:alpha/beta hydrolase [Chitinophaga pinensis]|uniref:Alpha/beta hydrolase n=1 Tax=Chitinophaga pinensis TaxID=79329 RepID=A0A5C6LLR3_9BACT|nr:alpha/beta hydrolase [Chitinophaga pinensis]TWV93269.1 alpha/beta hydrolase [Chitinophaga pinensis]
MKEKAAAMWKDDDFSGPASEWHAGSYFLKKLLEYQQQQGELSIDLVGHSAGSIVICELIKKLAAAGIPLQFRNILFLAPACRCDLFADAVLKHPERFQRFRIFTMQDIYETKTGWQPRYTPDPSFTLSPVYWKAGY